jgi:hypothetical protein
MRRRLPLQTCAAFFGIHTHPMSVSSMRAGRIYFTYSCRRDTARRGWRRLAGMATSPESRVKTVARVHAYFAPARGARNGVARSQH